MPQFCSLTGSFVCLDARLLCVSLAVNGSEPSEGRPHDAVRHDGENMCSSKSFTVTSKTFLRSPGGNMGDFFFLTKVLVFPRSTVRSVTSQTTARMEQTPVFEVNGVLL